MRAIIPLIALLLVGCEDVYRYPCQDPANKDNPECSRPICENDGFCYDMLNGLPPPQTEQVVEEAPASVECNNSETEVVGE